MFDVSQDSILSPSRPPRRRGHVSLMRALLHALGAFSLAGVVACGPQAGVSTTGGESTTVNHPSTVGSDSPTTTLVGETTTSNDVSTTVGETSFDTGDGSPTVAQTGSSDETHGQRGRVARRPDPDPARLEEPRVSGAPEYWP